MTTKPPRPATAANGKGKLNKENLDDLKSQAPSMMGKSQA